VVLQAATDIEHQQKVSLVGLVKLQQILHQLDSHHWGHPRALVFEPRVVLQASQTAYGTTHCHLCWFLLQEVEQEIVVQQLLVVHSYPLAHS
jgi:hypothetical protein